jgi:ATP-binding protein involved in chromosome partitioning
MPTQEQVQDALREVIDPAFGKDIVSLGLVQELKIAEGRVALDLQIVRSSADANNSLKQQVERALKGVPGVESVEVSLTAQARSAGTGSGQGELPGVANVIPIASGKGGVGKSTVSANLAVALAQTGARVGLLDADVYGPSIPMIMGATEAPQRGGRGIMPVMCHGVKIISTGFFTKPDQAVVWRGPMLSKMLTDLARQVEWGELDYLLVDLPPGTGDVQLTLCQQVALTGAVIVTTPQPVAAAIAEKAIIMFEQLKTPILGIIENMAYYESRKTGERDLIFGAGGAATLAHKWKTPLLAQVPLATTVRETSDSGTPIVLADPDAPAAKAFVEAAAKLVAEVAMKNANAEKPVEINF